MDTDVLGTSDVILNAVGRPQRIPRPAGFMPECLLSNDSFWYTCSSRKRTRFTPLISNIRVLERKYIRKLTRPLKDVLFPSYKA